MRYTLDGTTPTTSPVNGTLISGTSGYVTIPANSVKTLKALAYGAAYQNSGVTSAVFDRVDHTTTCVPPTFNPVGQSEGHHPPVAVPVTISTTTTGASISYTLSTSSNDIPTPTHGTIVNGTSTTAWIGVNAFWYLKAMVFKTGSYNSSVTSGTYDNTDPGGGGDAPAHDGDKQSGQGSRQTRMDQMNSVRTVDYTLDKCGNRTQVTDAGATKTYAVNNLNQYTTGHGMGVTNGASHEISSYNGTTYNYIADSYLAKASTVTGTNSYTLFYDALGRCVKRTSVTNGGTPVTNYYIFEGEHWIMEYDAIGANTSNALYGLGMDEVIARGTNTQGNWWYFPDRNGNISVVTDGVNTVRESYRYDAFGAPTVTVGPGQTAINNRFLFTGREWNATYGFYEYRARAYNPTIGRFMSEDPKDFAAGDYNLYRYCHNDPMDLSDPMGLYWLPLTKAQQKIFDQVRKYLSRDDGMKKLFEAIDKDRAHGVKVVFTDDFKSSNKDQFKGFGNSKGPTRAEFEWNPAAARSNTNGTKSSPAMVFGHELDHVVRWLNDPKGYERDNKPDGPGAYHQFGTFEERRVIRGSETHAAETLRKYGEGVRNDGGGAPYRVESPTFD